MQLHENCQGRCCCCFHQFPKQRPTYHVLCQSPSLLTKGQRCGPSCRRSVSYAEFSRRVRSRCFSGGSLEPQGRSQPPLQPPETKATPETVSSKQHAVEPGAQEQLQKAIRHAASLQQLRSLLIQVQQCHERQEDSLGSTGQRSLMFTMFLRTGKLLLRRHKDLNRSFLQRLRAMARPNQQRPGLNMPLPSSMRPVSSPAHHQPLQQHPLHRSTPKQQVQASQAAVGTLQAGQGSTNDDISSSSSERQHASDDSCTAHTLLQSMLCTCQPWLAEAQPHEAAYILLALGAAQGIPLQPDTSAGQGTRDINEEDVNEEDSSSSSSSGRSSRISSSSGRSVGASVSPYAAETRLLLQAVQPCLLLMKPSHLARIIWGTGAAGVKPSPVWAH
ncbi:hypothetical protein DUNSADRAFT_2594, partial [Dunaliella salina]